jgi:hypothetical protein
VQGAHEGYGLNSQPSQHYFILFLVAKANLGIYVGP